MALDGLVIVLIGVIILFGYIFNKIINLNRDCLKIINKQQINDDNNLLNPQPNQHE
jgi:hypothetical protein